MEPLVNIADGERRHACLLFDGAGGQTAHEIPAAEHVDQQGGQSGNHHRRTLHPCCGMSATAAVNAMSAAVTGCCWPVVKVTP